MSLEITGTLEKILEVQTGEKKDGSGTWEKQEFLVRTEEQYNNLYCFEVFGADKVENLAKFNKDGDSVKISFNVNTNEYNGKYYTSLSAWRVDKLEQQEIQEDKTPPPLGDEDLNLPF